MKSNNIHLRKKVKILHKAKWDKWGDRLNIEGQEPRLQRAKKADCTPVSVDKDKGEAVFCGSHGYYKTNLHECMCRDFTVRHAPCKHIYRLAIELGILDEEVSIGVPKQKIKSISLKETVSKIEEISIDAQIILKNFLLEYIFHKHSDFALPDNDLTKELFNSGIIIPSDNDKALLEHFSRNELNSLLVSNGITNFKKNLKLTVLINWCLENIKPQIKCICSMLISCTLSPEYKKNIKKVYTYLMRKFDDEDILNEEMELFCIPKGANYTFNNGILKCDFPDDEITDLLNKYKANRCL